MEVKVLGTGCCGNCSTTYALIKEVAQARGVMLELSKVEDLKDIMSFGIMSTPGVVIDGKVVHTGGVPSRDKIEHWLANAAPAKAPVPAQAEGPASSTGAQRAKCCG